ncbi:MAG TPA: hypothetical protein VF717_05990 [Pyrinomonadaceae bacterium]|jgi:hypothetical protein
MSSIVEYSYEYDNGHLSEEEALEKYSREKANHPNAIVIIDDLDCGHLEVEVYETEREKQAFYRKKLAEYFDNVWDAFKK